MGWTEGCHLTSCLGAEPLLVVHGPRLCVVLSGRQTPSHQREDISTKPCCLNELPEEAGSSRCWRSQARLKTTDGDVVGT